IICVAIIKSHNNCIIKNISVLNSLNGTFKRAYIKIGYKIFHLPCKNICGECRKEWISIIVYSMIDKYLNILLLPFFYKRKDQLSSFICARLKAINKIVHYP